LLTSFLEEESINDPPEDILIEFGTREDTLDTIKEAKNEETAPEDEQPNAPYATMVTVDPTSSHSSAVIHKTTRVGLTLVRQATNELELDSKFDAQPRNQKAFFCKLTKRSMDCCWEAHGILTFTVNNTLMNLNGGSWKDFARNHPTRSCDCKGRHNRHPLEAYRYAAVKAHVQVLDQIGRNKSS
jgi:hypothetical protein